MMCVCVGIKRNKNKYPGLFADTNWIENKGTTPVQPWIRHHVEFSFFFSSLLPTKILSSTPIKRFDFFKGYLHVTSGQCTQSTSSTAPKGFRTDTVHACVRHVS